MNVIINGEKKDVETGISISALITSLKLKEETIVVEVNGDIVDKNIFKEQKLNESDKVEFVRFVGGG